MKPEHDEPPDESTRPPSITPERDEPPNGPGSPSLPQPGRPDSAREPARDLARDPSHDSWLSPPSQPRPPASTRETLLPPSPPSSPSSRPEHAGLRGAGAPSREAVSLPPMRPEPARESAIPSSGRAEWARESAIPSSGRAEWARESAIPSSGRAERSRESLLPPSGRAERARESAIPSSGRAEWARESALPPSGRAALAEGERESLPPSSLWPERLEGAGDGGRQPSGVGFDAGRLLLVDDEAGFAGEAGEALREAFGAERVHEASEWREALRVIERERPAVLVADVRRPALMGLELIARARELWGAVPTVALTTFAPPAVRSGATSDTFRYLPKPCAAAALLATVRELEARPRPAVGRPGAVATLADQVQLYAAAGATGALAVRSGGLRGEVWFEAGRIVHARTASKEGAAAFHDIVRWPHGSFGWRARRAEARTIEVDAAGLLLEAYRGWGESRRSSEDLWDADRAPGGAPRGPAAPAAAGRGARETESMNNINEILSRLQSIDGFIGACLVDSESGMTLGLLGGGATLNLEVAAAANTEVVRSKRKAMRALNLKDEIEDILITLGKQYHLMRPLRARPAVFFYVALDRSRANLAMARLTLADGERDLTL